jgi:hypothetical protein
MLLHPDRWKTCQLKACGVHRECCQIPCMHTMIKTPRGLRFPKAHPDSLTDEEWAAFKAMLDLELIKSFPGLAVSEGASKFQPLPPPHRAISPSSRRTHE